MRRRLTNVMFLAPLLAALLLAAGCGGGEDSGKEGEIQTGPQVKLDENGPPFVASLGWGTFQLNPRIAEKIKRGETKFTIRFVSVAIAATFFAPYRDALSDAGEEFGVDIKLVGPTDFDIESQASTLESVLATSVDGIIFSCPSPDIFVPLIDRAVDKGIPVVAAGDDCPTAKRMAFVGQDRRNSGRVAGQEFLRHFRKAHPQGGGPYEVALFAQAPDVDYARGRFAGFREILSSSPDIKFIGPIATDVDPARQFAVAEDTFRANPNLAGVYVADESILGVATYIDRAGLAGKVTAVGNNLVEGIPQFIDKGVIQASFGQYAYQQAFRAVEILHKFLTRGTIPPCDFCDVGSKLVNGDNVETFLALSEKEKNIQGG